MNIRKVILICLTFALFLASESCDLRSYRKLEMRDSSTITKQNKKDSLTALRDKQTSLVASPAGQAVITHLAYVKTSMGSFTIALYGEDAPETVANFIGLIKMKYYNGILFHRIAKNFLIQAGDKNTLFPNKKAEWGFGGESFYGGEIEDELNPKTPSYRAGYVKGVAAMANKGPNTNSSQFFICLDKAKSLEHKWTIFGKVTEGLEVVEKISEVQVEPGDRGNFDGIPVKPVRIYSINIKFIKSPEIK